MAITVTNLGASQPGSIAAPDFDNNADQTGYDSASWSPPTCDLILCWVYNTKATTLGNEPAVSGNGLTWVKIDSVGVDPGAQTHRLTLFAADASGGPSTGVTSITFASQTQTCALVFFQRVDGVDLSGGVAAAIIQTPTNSSSAATSLAVSMSAAANSNNRFFCGIGHGQPDDHSVEAGWDELDDYNGTSPGHALVVFWDADSVADTSPSASWATSGAAVGIAIEIKAEAGTAFTETITDSLGLTDDVTLVEIVFNRTLTNTVGFTDTNSNARELNRTLTNTVGLTDLVSRAYDKVISLADTLGLTDLLIKSKGYILTISDALGLTDLISAIVTQAQNYTVTITDVLGFTDSVSSIFVHISRSILRGARNLYDSLRGKKDSDDLEGHI